MSLEVLKRNSIMCILYLFVCLCILFLVWVISIFSNTVNEMLFYIPEVKMLAETRDRLTAGENLVICLIK